MAEAKNIRLYTPGGERISDPALAEDYLAGGQGRGPSGRARALFYRDGGLKRYCIPFDQIDHAFTRVVACATHVCCGKMDLNTFRLVVSTRGRSSPRCTPRSRATWTMPRPCSRPASQGLKLGYTPPAQ